MHSAFIKGYNDIYTYICIYKPRQEFHPFKIENTKSCSWDVFSGNSLIPLKFIYQNIPLQISAQRKKGHQQLSQKFSSTHQLFCSQETFSATPWWIPTKSLTKGSSDQRLI